MTITLDTSLLGTRATSNPIVESYTCGANAKLLVIYAFINGTTEDLGAGTYNSKSMSKLTSYSDGTHGYVAVYYILAPDTGSAYNVSIANPNGRSVRLSMASFNSSVGAFALDKNGGGSGTSSNPSYTLNSVVANALIVGVCVDGYRNQVTQGANYTSCHQEDVGNWTYCSEYDLDSGSAGNIAVNFVMSTSDGWGITCASFKEQAPPKELWTTTGVFTWTRNDGRLRTFFQTRTTIGSFTWTRNNAILSLIRKILTATGNFIWTGMDAILTYVPSLNKLLQTITGVFTLTGNDARLRADRKTFTTTGVFSWTRNNAILLKAYKLFTTAGSFIWTRSNAILLRVYRLFTTAGNFVWTRSNAILLRSYKVFTTTGTFIWTGMNAILTKGGGLAEYVLQTITGNFTWTRNNAFLLVAHKLYTALGHFVWNSSGAILSFQRWLRAGVGSFVWTGWNAILKYITNQQPGTVDIADLQHQTVTLTDSVSSQTISIIDVAHGTVTIGDEHAQSI